MSRSMNMTRRLQVAAAMPAARVSRVIVAEDEPEMRRLLASRLRRAGYRVFEAGNASELLEWVATCERAATPAQLVIADVRMPGISGIDALEHLRRGGSRVPVILITAFGDRDVHRRARMLGAYAVVDKPFEFEQLERLIGKLPPPVRR